MTDSYKASHFLQYPTSTKMVAVSMQQTQHGKRQVKHLKPTVAGHVKAAGSRASNSSALQPSLNMCMQTLAVMISSSSSEQHACSGLACLPAACNSGCSCTTTSVPSVLQALCMWCMWCMCTNSVQQQSTRPAKLLLLIYLICLRHAFAAHAAATHNPLFIQYGEFRTGYNKDEQDSRILVYGLRYILENYVMRPWTADDVEKADAFFK
jgi:hypothetical protein